MNGQAAISDKPVLLHTPLDDNRGDAVGTTDAQQH
jgi:hypothetical protein